MRVLILIALLFAFTAGSYVELAHASSYAHSSEHHQMEHNDNADHEPCHSKQDHNHDENGCDGCCCVHSHSMATSPAPLKTTLNASKQTIIASADHHRSIDISGLKRPPRL